MYSDYRPATASAGQTTNDDYQLSDSYFPPFLTGGYYVFGTQSTSEYLAVTGHKEVRGHDTLTASTPSTE